MDLIDGRSSVYSDRSGYKSPGPSRGSLSSIVLAGQLGSGQNWGAEDVKIEQTPPCIFFSDSEASSCVNLSSCSQPRSPRALLSANWSAFGSRLFSAWSAALLYEAAALMHLVLMLAGDRDLVRRGEQKHSQGAPRGTALALIASGALHLGLINRANSWRNKNVGEYRSGLNLFPTRDGRVVLLFVMKIDKSNWIKPGLLLNHPWIIFPRLGWGLGPSWDAAVQGSNTREGNGDLGWLLFILWHHLKL